MVRVVGVRSVEGFEIFVAGAAIGAYPVFREVFESGAGADAVSGVAELRVVHIIAKRAFVLLHDLVLSNLTCGA